MSEPKHLYEHLSVTLSALLLAYKDPDFNLNHNSSLHKLSYIVANQCELIKQAGIIEGSYYDLCGYKCHIHSRTIRNACICGNIKERSIEPTLSYHCPICQGKYLKPLVAAIPVGFQYLLELVIFHLRINFAPEDNRLLEIHISQLEYILISYLNDRFNLG